jgi:hypothetical protein
MSLTFDDESHTYRIDGKVVPSVTQILRPLEADALARIPAEVLEWKRGLGQAVHLACQLDDEGALEESTVAMAATGYLSAWRKFRADTGFEVVLNECPMGSRKFRFAGTVDRYGILKRGPVTGAAVIDIKTRAELPDAIGPQLVGYTRLIGENVRDAAVEPHRIAVQLKADGTYATRVYTDPEDIACFQACLSLHHWMSKRK